ncbi:hypothetical protein [Gloeothece verrucosa]|uniref:Uncharacterized protein n=1 Tax=Gloeothece verrucosa (strain PCC 7822) TaxID=497965 RepID=E0U967_GLOV7|nr:hypothetical protein [Gloeothece verrucosa]ADN17325.1 hypothetical protein Cyan7822_5449 [Gloeothece verrucosa PCC 7822]
MHQLNHKNVLTQNRTVEKVRASTPLTIISDESLLATFDEIELLREQIQSWHSLAKLQNSRLEVLEQELYYTNQELCNAFMFQKKSFTEVIQLAKAILASGKSASECLAELIVSVYGFPVKLEDLQPSP